MQEIIQESIYAPEEQSERKEKTLVFDFKKQADVYLVFSIETKLFPVSKQRILRTQLISIGSLLIHLQAEK